VSAVPRCHSALLVIMLPDKSAVMGRNWT